MKINGINAAKVAGVACAATGIVTLSAIAASGAAVGAAIEGFKAAGDTMKRLLAEETEKETSFDGQPGDDSIAEGGSLT